MGAGEGKKKGEILGGPLEGGPGQRVPGAGGGTEGVRGTGVVRLAPPKSAWPPEIRQAMAQIGQANAGG